MSYDIPGYETPGCAYCPSTVRACRQGEGEERGPAFCPSKVDPDGVLRSDLGRRLGLCSDADPHPHA